MAPARLSPEEALQRKRDSKRRYQIEHADELREKRRMAATDETRAKWREDRKEKIERLVEAGLLVKLSPGRKRLYTPEEAHEVAKRRPKGKEESAIIDSKQDLMPPTQFWHKQRQCKLLCICCLRIISN